MKPNFKLFLEQVKLGLIDIDVAAEKLESQHDRIEALEAENAKLKNTWLSSDAYEALMEERADTLKQFASAQAEIERLNFRINKDAELYGPDRLAHQKMSWMTGDLMLQLKQKEAENLKLREAQSSEPSSNLDILRRIAERGLNLASNRSDEYVDIFQHMIDEIQRCHPATTSDTTALTEYRNGVIEECAKVCEDERALRLAEKLRAMKETK